MDKSNNLSSKDSAIKPTLELPEVEMIGRYKILRELGQGGMGKVYEALDTTLHRTVALKVLLGGKFTGTKQIQRFLKEARSTAELKHPNIVSFYEISCDEGTHFFTMEYIEGPTLKDLIKGKKLSLRKSIEIMEVVARAVHYAHGKGICHRDLKPANVMVDSNLKPYVMDFGLAKSMREKGGLTGSGEIIGTLFYMPPEQAEAKHRLVNEQSDVYSLGAIFYELITKRLPFHASSSLEVLKKITQDKPIAPRQINPRIPKEIEDICLKAMAKQQEKRYKSAKEFADQLRNFAEGGSNKKTSQPWGLIVVIVAVLLVVLTILFWPKSSQPVKDNKSQQNLAKTKVKAKSKSNIRETPKPNIDKPSPKKREIPFDERIWDICWDKENELFDFTKPAWTQLSITKKNEYVRKYQKWYAKSKNVPVMIVHKKVGIEVMLIPPGKFWRGLNKKDKSRLKKIMKKKYREPGEFEEQWEKIREPYEFKVIDRPFWIGRYEVTRKQWKQVMKGPENVLGREDYPARQMNWLECAKFCKRLGVRLPKETEWEYVCRAGTDTFYYSGDTLPIGQANYGKRYGRESIVGTKSIENPWGCFDLYGNVWEWCMDKHPYTKKGNFRFIRGGSWADSDIECRSAYRMGYRENSKRLGTIGFRIVMDQAIRKINND